MVFIIPSARREVELRDEKVAGYLAANARLDVRTFPEHQSAKNDGPRAARRRPRPARDEMTREPEHAGDEDGVQILSYPLEQIYPIICSPFLLSLSVTARSWPTLIGPLSLGLIMARSHWVGHDAFPYLARSQSNRFMTIFGNGIPSPNEFRTHPHTSERAENAGSRGLAL